MVNRLPQVAIVGRPNVGKSTLFNRMSGSRKAIVDAVAGSTRDRNVAAVEWGGKSFEVVDTGRRSRIGGDAVGRTGCGASGDRDR